MKAFKIILTFFRPTHHVLTVIFSNDIKISPIEGYAFSHWQSIQNIQYITDTGGCNKYCIKYIGKIDNQNYVIVYSGGHTNGKLVPKPSFLNNNKLSASKYNEDKKLNAKGVNYHTRGLAVVETEMLHNMLRYSEVSTELAFVDIATTPLEMYP